MKSPEQMGGLPEQPKRESGRKDTTHKEAAEMTRQRRKNFGLEEPRKLTPEEAEKIERSIEKLLEVLYQYDFDSFSPEIQNEWYFIEQEAMSGKDRELARANLEKFLRSRIVP